MRITRVYTRTGDRGTTRLVDGAEVAKDAVRIEAYGTVDECNATIGLVRDALSSPTSDPLRRLDAVLESIQHDLFDLGADLATPAASRWESMVRLDDADIDRLERWIDAMNATLPPLEEFVLPGGGPIGSALHLARTVCRRAERRAVTLVTADPSVGTDGVRYLNRLSDLLFVAGRYAARGAERPEPTWRHKAARAADPDPFAT